MSLRFPLSMTLGVGSYVAKKKLAGVKRFPMVLMLEPLHACNLTCTYTPPAGFAGTDQFVYTATAITTGTQASALVTVTIDPPPPSTATDDHLTTPAAVSLTFDPTVNDDLVTGDEFPEFLTLGAYDLID